MTNPVKPVILNFNPLTIQHPSVGNRGPLTLICREVYGWDPLLFYSSEITSTSTIKADVNGETFFLLTGLSNTEKRAFCDMQINALTQINEDKQKIWRIVGKILLVIAVVVGLSIAILNPPSGVAYLGVIFPGVGSWICLTTQDEAIMEQIRALNTGKTTYI